MAKDPFLVKYADLTEDALEELKYCFNYFDIDGRKYFIM